MPDVKLKWEGDSLQPDGEDDVSSHYLLSLQVAHEYHSSAVQSYINAESAAQQAQAEAMQTEQDEFRKKQVQKSAEGKAAEGAFAESMTQSLASRMQPQAAHGAAASTLPTETQPAHMAAGVQSAVKSETAGVEAPTIDPTMAFGAGFGAKLSMEAGKALMPSLGRALAAGVVNAATEYPIGMAADVVGANVPELALPTAVVLGLFSGGTIEPILERGIANAAAKMGQALSPAAIKAEVKAAAEMFTSGNIAGLQPEMVMAINDEIANTPLSRVMQALKGEKGELTIRDPNAPAEPLAPAPVKGGSKKSGIPKPGDMTAKADQMLADTNPDITTKYAGEATGGNIRIWSEDLMPKFVSDITSPEDIDRMLSSTQTVFAEQKQIAARGKQSWADTEAGSKQYGITDILGRRVGQALNDQQIESGRQFLAASSENLKGMADVVKSGTANDLQKMEFMRAFNIHYAVQMQMSGAAAEAGRALQIFRKVAESDTLRVGQLKDFMAGTVSTGIKPEDLAAKLADMDSPAQVAAFVREAKKANSYDMLMEAWINGLLSGPVTHSVNVTSNVLTSMWMIPERAMAAGISRLHGGDIRMGEVAAQSYGLVQGFKDGLGLAWQALRKGESSDLMGKIEQSQMRAITAENVQNLPAIKKLAPNALEAGGIAARAVDALGEVIRVPGRFLTAEDELFKSVGYRMELQAQAYRKAASEGLEGQAMSQRMRDIISNPQELAPEVHLAAVDAARYQTFTSDLGPGGKAIQTAANKIPGLKLVIPFIRTPANIMKFAAERTVLAPLMKSVRADIMAGGARRDMALARMSLGSMAMATVATYASAGYITGGGPADTTLRQHKYNQGWQPYSIKFGDKYYSYGRLEPLGMMMGLAADAVEIMGELDELESDKLATTIVASIGKNVMSKTWLRGLSEAVQALEDPDRHGSRWVKQFAGTAVPTGVAQIERTMYPEIADAQSAMEAIKARVPGYSKDLPTRRNLWGEKITFNGALGPDIVSPIFTSSEKDSPIDKELLRMRAPIRMPQRTQTFEGVPIKLDAYEYEEFMVRMNSMKLDSTGKTLKKSLDELVTKDKDYKSEKNDDMKERMIRAHIQEATEKTRAEMLETNQTLRLLVYDEHRRQAAVR